MGEVVVYSEGAGGMELELKATETAAEVENGSAVASSLVRWERFLPRMVLRVLLVEADDSTRQIIAALLRKCSYRVAAVSDGLKAWEFLKGKPHNVDLILTEVELPSISGFALLTLIAEHEICKAIPVIMMSSHDSVSTVYRCMLRGAADFLVKPVRKNELRNLWQHVWRRRTSTAGIGPPDESVAQQKIEATAENNAASNHSSGYMQCIQRNRDRIEKGTDAQSSCTKPDLVAEEAYMECRQDVSPPKWTKSSSRDMTFKKQEESAKASNLQIVNGYGSGGSEAVTKTNTLSTGDHMNFDDLGEHVIAISEACENSNSSKVAIDLIGAFDSDTKGDCQIKTTCKLDLTPLLDLSLRRSHPSGSVNQVNDDRQRLNHSDASAFSRYVNKALRPQCSTLPSICSKQRDYETDSDKKTCNHTALDNNSDSHALAYSFQNSLFALAAAQLGQSEMSLPCPQQSAYPAPIPVGGIRFENPCTNYRSVISPVSCAQTQSSPILSPGSAGHQEPSYKVKPFIPSVAELRNSVMDQNANAYNDEVEGMQGSRLECLDDQGQLLSVADRSASSSFDNGAICHFNSVCYVSNGNVNPPPVGSVASECGNEGGLIANVGNAHRSVQREVALNKFRLKRKERCFEKKVRYESRKKLAEQRPRVKGQFVRQVNIEPSLVNADSHHL